MNENGKIMALPLTYFRFPAMSGIEQKVKLKLALKGLEHFEVTKNFSRTCTADWIKEEAKMILIDYGIVLPQLRFR